jgi:hypothetical protein
LDKSGGKEFDVAKVDDLEAWRNTAKAAQGTLPASSATAAEWNFAVGAGADLFQKLSSAPTKLGHVARIFVGLQTSADSVFLFKEFRTAGKSLMKVVSKEIGKELEVEKALLKPVVRSGDIGRYWATPRALVLFPYVLDRDATLIPETELRKRFPNTWDYLLTNKALLAAREHGKFRKTGWYQLYPKNLTGWQEPKIMVPYMVRRLCATYDEEGLYFVNVTTGGFAVTVDTEIASMKYVTGLLNSRLLDWFIRNVTTTFHGGYFAANKQFIEQLPIRTIDFSDPADKARHDRMVELVERMLELHKRKARCSGDVSSPKSPGEHRAAAAIYDRRFGERSSPLQHFGEHSSPLQHFGEHSSPLQLEREIAATDREIDELVYELYGITEEERKIIEGAL